MPASTTPYTVKRTEAYGTPYTVLRIEPDFTYYDVCYNVNAIDGSGPGRALGHTVRQRKESTLRPGKVLGGNHGASAP